MCVCVFVCVCVCVCVCVFYLLKDAHILLFLAANDFTSLVNALVMFAASSSIGNMSCQYITINNDNITINNDNITEYDETFSVTLSASLPVLISPIAVLGASIDDNDGEDDFTLVVESFKTFSLFLFLFQ